MTLYELTNEYKRLHDMAEEMDLSPYDLKDTLDGMDEELSKKADGYGKVIRQMEAVPTFPSGDVPVIVAAKVYGRDPNWVRAGIISGWLPIGRATRAGRLVTDINQMDSRYGRISYQISPRKLWEDTGYIWNGESK